MTFPKIELTAEADGKSQALVLGWFQSEAGGEPGEKKDSKAPHFLGKKSKDVDGLLEKLKESRHFSARKNEVSLLRYFPFRGARNTVLLGLGQPKKWDGEVCRQSGAALSLAQRRDRLPSATVDMDSVFAKTGKDELALFVQAFCEGYLMAGYEYRDLKKTETDPFQLERLQFAGVKDPELKKAIERARILAGAVNFARSLGDRPGNYLTPKELGRLAQGMAKEHGLKCSVLSKAEIEKEKMGLLLGVSRGSAEDPSFIIMEHKGGKKSDKPVVLIGKGITFDAGGISLKPAARMEDMKYDMMGAATVIGVMQAIAQLDLPLNVVGLVAASENLPGGKAQKPGDVARAHSGKTVEIINTDAEGRLVLADAIEYAQRHLEPQAMIDFATLTGAVVDALGTVTAGIMGTSPALVQQIKDAARVTSERVWELPLFEEYEEDLKSHVADIKNSGIREAGSSKGGTFLKFFVDSKVPWVHCDIAGVAYHRKDVNYHPQKYGAGVLIRLITHLLETWQPVK